MLKTVRDIGFENVTPDSRENRTAVKLLKKFEKDAWGCSMLERMTMCMDKLEAGLGNISRSDVTITMRADGRDIRVECVQEAQPNGAVESLYAAYDAAGGEELCEQSYLRDLVDWMLSYKG